MSKRDIITTALEAAGALAIVAGVADLAGGAWALLVAGAALIFAGWSAS